MAEQNNSIKKQMSGAPASQTPVDPNAFNKRYGGVNYRNFPVENSSGDLDAAEDELTDETEDDLTDESEEYDDELEDISEKATNKMQKAKNGAKNAKTLSNLVKSGKMKWILMGIGILLVLLFLILLMSALFASDEESEIPGYTTDPQRMMEVYDPTYDFTLTIASINNPLSGEIVEEGVEYADLVKNIVYGYLVYGNLYNHFLALTDEQKLEFLKASLILIRIDPLYFGNYDYNTKNIVFDSGGTAYCSIYTGCKILKKKNQYAFLPINDKTKNITDNVISTHGPMDEKAKEILDRAYSETKYLILAPADTDELIKDYDYIYPYAVGTFEIMIEAVYNQKNYGKILYTAFDTPKYEIYNLADYLKKYELVGDAAWWWPIGSPSYDKDGLYSGTPVASTIVQEFGKTTTDTGSVVSNDGIDIEASCGSNVIVAKSGVVSEIGYDQSRGHYVVIDHKDKDKSKSYYYHLKENSIVVTEGNVANRGELIGLLGTSGAGESCKLHFAIYSNNSAIDPNNHVSLENPRPTSTDVNINFVSGVDKKQSICLTLKSSGFSNNATAAILANIYYESSYTPNNKGDWSNNVHTSYGLCQWHNGRKANLLNHCRTNYGEDAAVELDNTDDISPEMQELQLRCQLDYLIFELKTSYNGRYQVLLSNKTAYEMGWDFCYKFEIPAARDTSCKTRGNYSTKLLNEYVKPQTSNGVKGCGVD